MKDKLRIGIIGTRGIPNRYGGFEAFAEQVSGRLATRGHQVTVYCSHNQEYRESALNGVRLAYRYNPEFRMGTAGQFIYDLNCNLHSGKQSYHVILHLGYTSDSLWAWLWSSKAVHLTNMDGMEWMRSKYPPAVQSFLKKAEQWAARKSKILIADSTGIRDYLESRYQTPVRYISYGAVTPDSYHADLPGDFGVAPYQYDLVIARMEPENNIEMAIDAKISENSSAPLLIFSNGTAYGSRLINKHKGNALIRFHQANYQPEILDSLRHYSRYYIHGHSAGGTNPSLLEAMACECRILAHDNPFNRGVLRENGGFYRSAHQLAGLLSQTGSQETYLAYAANNLETIEKQHDWEHITNEYERVFYEATGK